MPTRYAPGAPRPTGSLRWEGLSTTTPDASVFEIAIDDVFVPSEMRAIDEDAITRIVESIQEIGLQAQGVITVEWNPPGGKHRATLFAGRHRLEAFRRLGWEMIPTVVFDGSAAEAERWRIAENLCRKELTALERAEHLARWLQLRAEKPAHLAQVSGGRGHKGGISAAAEELGVDRRTVQRGVKVSGLSDEAKTVAVRLGLADNQMALTSAAGAGGAAEQIRSLHDTARRIESRRKTPEQIAAIHRENRQFSQRQTDWVDCASQSLFEWLGAARTRQFLDMIDKAAMPEMAPIEIVDRLRRLSRNNPD
jgi:ParB-like chromosome segregation protein Spo0J